MRMSPQARAALVEAFEGRRTTAYRDSVGILSIGYGHTSAAGAPIVRPGMTITREEADAILARDLEKVEAAVTSCIKIGCRPREFDAICDLAFNVGCGNLRSSTLLRLFNRGDRAGAANAFLMWNRAGGRVLPGLTRRREAERAWFLGQAPGEPPALGDMPHAVDHPDPIVARVVNRVALAVRR